MSQVMRNVPNWVYLVFLLIQLALGILAGKLIDRVTRRKRCEHLFWRLDGVEEFDKGWRVRCAGCGAIKVIP